MHSPPVRISRRHRLSVTVVHVRIPSGGHAGLDQLPHCRDLLQIDRWTARPAARPASDRFGDGFRHGHWVVRKADGTVAELQYVNAELR